jgi:molybdopterin/thiamine biosynthesis adenylyltransferase
MDDRALQRYSRHIMLAPIDLDGQQRLLDSHVLVVGAGGLGAPALMYLASAGVGRLTVCDGDEVDLTNLQRQIVHREATIGVNKAESAARTLRELNSDCRVRTLPRRVGRPELLELAAEADVVVDASDNFATRRAINAACVQLARPLVSGAAVRFSGHVAVFDLRRADGPCYACFLPEDAAQTEDRCATLGVFAPLTGIIGCMQAAETIRLIALATPPPQGEVVLFDALEMQTQRIEIAADPECPVCAMRRTKAHASQPGRMTLPPKRFPPGSR